MARARNIKPGFFANEYLAELPYEARLLFIGLWTLCDRRGRLEDRPKGIKGRLFPFDSINVDEMLALLAGSPERFIIRYSVNGNRYIQVSNFEKHQNPHCKEAESVIPSPAELAQDKHGTSTVQALYEHGESPADSLKLIPDSLNPITDSRAKGAEAPDIPKTAVTRFIPPTFEEITDYCKDRKNSIDPQRFIDFYSSKGWMIGKNKMKDWRAAIRTWEKGMKADPKNQPCKSKNYDEGWG